VKHAKGWLSVGLVIGAIAVGVLLAEAGLRLFYPQQLGVWYQDREGLGLHWPGLVTRFPQSSFPVAFNSAGMRDREHAVAKPDGVFRVLVLGDSFMEALQVPFEESFPSVVEHELSQETGRRVEVVNASVSGWGTDDELKYLTRYGTQWKPDLILVAMTLHNDISDNLREQFHTIRNGALIEQARPDETLYRSLDFAKLIKKTPIVVNDSRGFFTSRVIGTFINEGIAMLLEGVPAPSIEQASSQAGYPAPVLQLMDELTLTLPQKIRKESRAAVEAAGGTWVEHPSEAVIDRLVDEFKRPGRAGGAGFYDYSDGQRTSLWPGLRTELGATNHDVDVHELSERMLFVESLETWKCVDEGVLTSIPDANIGSIFGIGFPPWTGGVLQYIDGYAGGKAGFVARADELAKKYGERFAVPDSLRAAAAAEVGSTTTAA